MKAGNTASLGYDQRMVRVEPTMESEPTLNLVIGNTLRNVNQNECERVVSVQVG